MTTNAKKAENAEVESHPSTLFMHEKNAEAVEARRTRWAKDFAQVKGFSPERMNDIYGTLDIAHFALGKSQQDMRKEMDEIAQKIPEMKRIRAAEREEEAKGLTGELKQEAKSDAYMLRKSADKFAAMDVSDDRMRRAVMLQYMHQIAIETPDMDNRVATLSPEVYGSYKKTFNHAVSLFSDADGRGGGSIVDGAVKARAAFLQCTVDAEGDMSAAIGMFKKQVFGEAHERGHRADVSLDAMIEKGRGGGGKSRAEDGAEPVGGTVDKTAHVVIPVKSRAEAEPIDYTGVEIKGVDALSVAEVAEHEAKREAERTGGKIAKTTPAVTVRLTGIKQNEDELAGLSTASYEHMRIDRESKEERLQNNRYVAALPIAAADNLPELNYAVYRVLIDSAHLLDWTLNAQGEIALKAKSMDKLDTSNTISKVLKTELGYDHERGASLAVHSTLKKLNVILANIELDKVEPSVKVLDRIGTPTKELTAQIREKKAKDKGKGISLG
ncbi:hypothetical protein Acife_1987 [Acidithiobacillus ferrivorans SS3]|uniref:Uncharacterized protein n=1 Tax=Acidithiobacillus ferrivorans SS3 TaxID=743299 RepID=G0JM57_9PROT|nr:hypothetical protein [Acidithiobacillus ferrivorans]AEM48107.1 hypothetical protein Acife_1987 [Acidithiobacillus ferrivorans SS3]